MVESALESIMPSFPTPSAPSSLTVQLEGVVDLDENQLFELCRRNRDLRIERTARGEIVVMTPAGGRTSNRNIKIAAQLELWAERDETGEAFDSSGGFTLPSGAMRSPDAAWVERSQLRELPPSSREKFLPLCPTFVIELRSPSDPLSSVQSKLEEYIDNGTRLGWLIDPIQRRVYVYRPGLDAEILDQPRSVAGDPELPGFVLELVRIWDPSW